MATGLFPVNRNVAASIANRQRKRKQRPMQSSARPRAKKEAGSKIDRRKLAPSPIRDEVAAHLAAGFELGEIAERMGLTIKSVRHHFDKIRKRLGPQAV